ncbi:hypothetical protein ENKNEFLB_02636 [Nocardioides aquaticus]|uniref:DUF202 domain-containing protein n=1 Tax=Nocardioides aquaticus TaxID=160826 RepID=A0ABX8EK10_9ACTN|nr:hypothetical protein ENKNEFLB_02636 [Nocardioides aquaticus]
MSLQVVRSLLIIVGAGLNIGALVLNAKDRDRRERATRERPQPLQYTREARILTGFSLVALLGAVVLFLV